MSEFFPFLIGVILVATPAWLMGWYFGAQTLKTRHRAYLKAIEENNTMYKDWGKTDAGSNYERGYQDGIHATLNTLAGFIDKASD